MIITPSLTLRVTKKRASPRRVKCDCSRAVPIHPQRRSPVRGCGFQPQQALIWRDMHSMRQGQFMGCGSSKGLGSETGDSLLA